ncbi:MAG TPA: LamG domain-containing protein [Salinivirga sp.]|uniref:LamG domain-containing protein n=1 Tax=Salinivirga sp. TaxID=1970192 RepID=UPI002B4A7A0C|nr:LamG domain-containing protein [Salinivirga sp.]HKK59635.1 LamG domain-containing protein [Salinivirga sp.]
MKNITSIILIAIAIITSFSACSDKELNEHKKNWAVSFGFSNEALKKNHSATPDAMVISIKNDASDYELYMERLELYAIGDGYITANVELLEGNYTVEDFIVVDENDSVMYLTPKEGSNLSSSVNTPLPHPFNVNAADTSNVILDVIPTNLGEAEDYGYTSFSFNIVYPISYKLVLSLPFNGNANDESGNEDHASVSGAQLTTDRFDQPNSAYEFDGYDDYISLSSFYDLEVRTINIWFKAYEITEDLSIVYNSDNPSLENGRSILALREFDGADSITFVMDDNTYSKRTAVEENTWNMASFVRNDSSTTFYLNGELIDQVPASTISSIDGQTETAVLGTGRNLNRFLNGKIDDVRIYNRALNASEIEVLFNLEE